MLLTIKDLSKTLQIKRSTLYAWVKQGKIPSLKLNGVVRFIPQEVSKWLETSRLAASPPVLALGTSHPVDIDALIARAKREAYTPAHGETRPKSSLIRKEDVDGAD